MFTLIIEKCTLLLYFEIRLFDIISQKEIMKNLGVFFCSVRVSARSLSDVIHVSRNTRDAIPAIIIIIIIIRIFI